MNYNILAIFNDSQLKEIEEISSSTLMSQGLKNQMVKAVEDYRYLVNSLPAKGLTEQVIFFLLNSDSCTPEGIEKFMSKLEIWIEIVEDEKEQRLYADILYYLDTHIWEVEEILALRGMLLDILIELEQIKPRIDTQIPMQTQKGYPDYSTWMMNYGSEFEQPDSSFNIVPNLKKHPSQTEVCDSFAVYSQMWEVPTLQS